MPNTKDRVYVVIPNYIVTEELKQLATDTINSFRQSYPEAIIVSVDDGSPMDCTFLKEMSDIYIKNKKNSGFGVTCNNGFKKIFKIEKEDCYIICANNDIRVNKRTIPALIEPFEMFDNVAITGIWSTTERRWEGGVELEDFNLGKISEGGLLGDRMQDGGLWMSKKSILKKIGIFDEQFLRGGFEDVDIFMRAKLTYGMKIVMSNRAIYWHKQGATRWNCEKNNYINNFGLESKSIEEDNFEKFKNKWGFNPRRYPMWNETLIFNI